MLYQSTIYNKRETGHSQKLVIDEDKSDDEDDDHHGDLSGGEEEEEGQEVHVMKEDVISARMSKQRVSFQLVGAEAEQMAKDLRKKAREPAKVGASNKANIGGGYIAQLKKEIDDEMMTKIAAGSVVYGKKTSKGGGMLLDDIFDPVTAVIVSEFRKVEKDFLTSEEFTKYLQIICLETHEKEEKDFFNMRKLGVGGFGEVSAMKKLDTGKLYAVKAMSKKKIKKKKSEALCWNERDALSEVSSPFVVGLKYCFQTDDLLYLALDLMNGGDLSYHLAVNGAFSHKQARFHAMEILLGLEHLHDLGLVYRDLKPENVLINFSGHCKISDLGLAVKVGKGVKGCAGTLGYMAPEMFRRDKATGVYDPENGKRRAYGTSVDWFAVGAMIIEMLTGKCPFRTQQAKEFFQKTYGKEPEGGNPESYKYATCSMDVDYESYDTFSEKNTGKQARSICMGLMDRNLKKRLGCSENRLFKLKQHPWFVNYLDWTLMASSSVTPPFKPDTSDMNVESEESIMARESAQDNGDDQTLDEKDQEKWKKWNFVHHTAFQEEMVEYLEWEAENGPLKPESKSSACVLL